MASLIGRASIRQLCIYNCTKQCKLSRFSNTIRKYKSLQIEDKILISLLFAMFTGTTTGFCKGIYDVKKDINHEKFNYNDDKYTHPMECATVGLFIGATYPISVPLSIIYYISFHVKFE